MEACTVSETKKHPHAQMLRVADHIVAALRPACWRIEIAGSLRRNRPMVGDIEIVATPKLHTNLIGDPMNTSEVDDLLAQWPVTLSKNGPKYKAFSFEWQPGTRIKVDLFLPLPACWSVVYMLRTGSSDFSRRMVTAKSQGGYRPEHLRVQGGRVWNSGRAIDLESEADLFRLWDMDFIEPSERV